MSKAVLGADRDPADLDELVNCVARGGPAAMKIERDAGPAEERPQVEHARLPR